MSKKFNCPVCGKPAFDSRLNFDICPTCGWEDDTDETDPTSVELGGLGANSLTLDEARKFYQEIGHLFCWDGQIIKNHTALATVLNTTVARLRKTIYRMLDCGPWVALHANGLEMGSIVEGVYAGTQTYSLLFPFSMKDFHNALEAIGNEAGAIWNATHGCPECGEADESGYIAINPSCGNCEGEGVKI